jgi:hypothetical protein
MEEDEESSPWPASQQQQADEVKERGWLQV